MRQTACFAIAAFVLSMSMPARAGEGDKQAGNLPEFTYHDYYKQLLEYNRQTLSGAYKEVGRRGVWDAEAVRFLDQMAVAFSYARAQPPYQVVRVPTRGELIEAGRAVRAAGCEDPLVGYCLAVKLDDEGHDAEAIPLLTALLPLLDESDYPDLRVFAAARRLQGHLPDTPAGRDAARIAGLRVGELPFQEMNDLRRREALDDVWAHVEGLPSREAQSFFLDSLRGRGGGDPWLLDVMEGRLLIKKAWDSRGSGWADSVTEEGWRGFYDHLENARDALTQAWKLRPNLPEAPTEMISVALGAGARLGEDERTWFNRATSAQVDYFPAYQSLYEALLPRWGGSHEEIYRIGLDAAKTKRYDTLLPWQLIAAASRIADDIEEGGWATIIARPGVYAQLDGVLNGYATALEPHVEDGWYRSLRVALAWRAGKHAEAYKGMEILGEELQIEAFQNFGAKYPAAAAGQAYVMGGPEGARAGRAEAAMKAGKNKAAIDEFRAIASSLSGKPWAEPYLQARVTVLDRRLRYAAGKWVDLQPRGDFVGWRRQQGQWAVNGDGVLVGNFDPGEKHQYLICDEDFGDRFEISVRLEQLPQGISACVTFWRGAAYGGEVLVGPSSVTLLERTGRVLQKANNTSPLECTIRCDAGQVDVRVNGQEWKGLAFAPAGGEGMRVGVGAQGVGTVGFTGLKIRKLSNPVAAGGQGAGQPVTGGGKK